MPHHRRLAAFFVDPPLGILGEVHEGENIGYEIAPCCAPSLKPAETAVCSCFVPRRSCRARRARCRKRRRRAGRLHKYRQRFQTPIGLSTTRSVPAIRARSGWPGPHQGARVSGRPAVVIISVSAVCRWKSNRKFADSPLSKCAPQSCRDKAVFAAGSSAANGRVRQLLSR
jgi:hypothetical protein